MTWNSEAGYCMHLSEPKCRDPNPGNDSLFKHSGRRGWSGSISSLVS